MAPPLCSEPTLHLVCTGVACYLGWLAHCYEENSEERVQRLLERHRHAPKDWAVVNKPYQGGKGVMVRPLAS